MNRACTAIKNRDCGPRPFSSFVHHVPGLHMFMSPFSGLVPNLNQLCGDVGLCPRSSSLSDQSCGCAGSLSGSRLSRQSVGHTGTPSRLPGPRQGNRRLGHPGALYRMAEHTSKQRNWYRLFSSKEGEQRALAAMRSQWYGWWDCGASSQNKFTVMF